MRQHIFFGSGRCVLKQHIQKALHSKSYPSAHKPASRSSASHPPVKHSGKKISPLRFKF